MRILVTGVAGFIASRTASMLLDQGHEGVGGSTSRTRRHLSCSSANTHSMRFSISLRGLVCVTA